MSIIAERKKVDDLLEEVRKLKQQLAAAVEALKAIDNLLDEYGESENPAIDTLNKIEGISYPVLAKLKEGNGN